LVLRRTQLWATVSIAAAAFAYAWVLQGVGGYPQNSQYALVRALAAGTPNIDRTRHEVGELGTLDARFFEGHYYSNKAPGLAFLTVPPYLLLERLGAAEPGDPSEMLWALGLVGVVLPATLLLVLVRRVGEWLEPGCGTVAAIVLGLGTLVLPYATMLYNHVLAALLAFAAFVVLHGERRSAPRLAPLVVAGALAGLGVTTEYANVLAAAVLLGYAAARGRPLRRALAYGGGLLLGVAPLLAYNVWAFGSPFHNSYSGRLLRGGESFGGSSSAGDQLPIPRGPALLENLASSTGIAILAPVVVWGAAGLVLVWRRGWRAEALTAVGIGALFLAYVSSYGASFGGFGPGQRYLIPVLPFVAFPLAALLRAYPATTVGLALVSGTIMVSATATHALAGYDGEWFSRVAERQFTSTAASVVDVTGWYAIAPFFAAVGTAAVAAGLATTAVRTSPADTMLAGAAVLAWALLAATAPRAAALGGTSDDWGAYWAVAALAAGAVLLLGAMRLRAPREEVPLSEAAAASPRRRAGV
jgi:hypothetical protein